MNSKKKYRIERRNRNVDERKEQDRKAERNKKQHD
jgi:hypothetical protein